MIKTEIFCDQCGRDIVIKHHTANQFLELSLQRQGIDPTVESLIPRTMHFCNTECVRAKFSPEKDEITVSDWAGNVVTTYPGVRGRPDTELPTEL